ncbi:hypothetical protein L6R50_11250 [Myxococcota bacterium]|nr:hypothetical protein [Myxococcota bacterium]
MPLSASELQGATVAAGMLLDALGLAGFLFEVEPRDGPWEVRVDCALARGGHQSAVLRVDKDRLLASRADPGVRAALLAEWAGPLAECRKE